MCEVFSLLMRMKKINGAFPTSIDNVRDAFDVDFRDSFLFFFFATVSGIFVRRIERPSDLVLFHALAKAQQTTFCVWLIVQRDESPPLIL